MILATHGILANSGIVSIDTDAQAFITATGITDTIQKNAINTLVTDLKSYGIWSKMKALYPFVGGTATTHKFNLKDPRDLDAAFRLQFVGGGIHSSTGYKPNAINTNALTFFNISSHLSSPISSNHISIYIRDNIDALEVDMGVYNPLNLYGIDIESRIGNVAYYKNQFPTLSFSNTDSRGFHVNSRTQSNLCKIFINNVLKTTDTSNQTLSINGNISLAARYNINNNFYEYRSSKEQSFASIGDGLTDSEVSNYYTAVQKFQTTLSRNV